jgi:hypothetical protein
VTDPNAQTPSAAPAAPSSGAPPKKSSFGCLKILFIFGAIMALLFLTFVILAWQAASWAKNAPEPTAASYPPLNLSEGEKEDVQRILGKLNTIKQTREVLDEFVTPDVFNGVMEAIIEGEKKKQKTQHDEPLFFRAGFSGENLELKLTKQVQAENNTQPMYVNVAADFKLEVADGRVTEFSVEHLLVHDTPPPLLARIWLSIFSRGITQGKDPNARVNANVSSGNTNWLEVFKLIKREGDRVHFEIDGSKLKD